LLTGGSRRCNGEACSALPRWFLIRVYTYARLCWVSLPFAQHRLA
jgi:hypothetical protein